MSALGLEIMVFHFCSTENTRNMITIFQMEHAVIFFISQARVIDNYLPVCAHHKPGCYNKDGLCLQSSSDGALIEWPEQRVLI